jgi:hypothetical protein
MVRFQKRAGHASGIGESGPPQIKGEYGLGGSVNIEGEKPVGGINEGGRHVLDDLQPRREGKPHYYERKK